MECYTSKMQSDVQHKEQGARIIQNVGSEEIPEIKNSQINEILKQLTNNKAAEPEETLMEN